MFCELLLSNLLLQLPLDTEVNKFFVTAEKQKNVG